VDQRRDIKPAPSGRERPPMWVLAAAAASLLLDKLKKAPAASTVSSARTQADELQMARGASRDGGRHPRSDEGHGRNASSPSEFSARGWKDILWGLQRASEDRSYAAEFSGVALASTGSIAARRVSFLAIAS
jgi:hypothetical protein